MLIEYNYDNYAREDLIRMLMKKDRKILELQEKERKAEENASLMIESFQKIKGLAPKKEVAGLPRKGCQAEGPGRKHQGREGNAASRCKELFHVQGGHPFQVPSK